MGKAFTPEDIAQLKNGTGETLYGDGSLVILKALLESGVSYFGGYPGAPTSNLIDAAADAYEDVLKDMGIFFESSSNEMAAAAMCTASVFSEVRGAVTWKVLGNGVATDVADHISQLGVKDGVLFVVGEDYGVTSTTVAQRTLPWAMKSGIPVVDPRGDQQRVYQLTKDALDMSQASHAPVAFLMRPQVSHVNAKINVQNNRRGKYNVIEKMKTTQRDPSLMALTPLTQVQERARYDERLPAARQFIIDRGMNERFGNPQGRIGIITHGVVFNTIMRILSLVGLADESGQTHEAIDILQLNVVNPLCDDQLLEFMAGKERVLLVEEGQPELLETQIRALLQRTGTSVNFTGHNHIPAVGELSPAVLFGPLTTYLAEALPDLAEQITASAARHLGRITEAQSLLPEPVTPRIPSFCTGCPERPVFSMMKIKEYHSGKPEWHAGDVGCYGMAILPPFQMADSNIGMGGGMAAATALSAMSEQKNVSVVGDGTLWHSAMNTSVANGVYNKQDATYIVLDNGWTSMTGAHENPNSGADLTGHKLTTDMSIEKTFRGMGIKQIERVNPYDYKRFYKKWKAINDDPEPQVRVLISEAECQLQRQRRIKPQRSRDIKAGKRVEVERLGVDDEVCVGDHACIRFNGCPSLTLEDGPNTLKSAPVAKIDETCVGCGVCGEVSTAAQLCPSFFKVRKIENETWFEKLWGRLTGWMVPVKQAV
ncbi:MAG: indolepyruvate ferredoxin oxidoreductase subunit alpha [Gammaproteobacteria bacterium]|nr:indolepyruvate ferredoxin oxidoreductase subunit alpha [Gammaproteobacteria bacterium]